MVKPEGRCAGRAGRQSATAAQAGGPFGLRLVGPLGVSRGRPSTASVVIDSQVKVDNSALDTLLIPLTNLENSYELKVHHYIESIAEPDILGLII